MKDKVKKLIKKSKKKAKKEILEIENREDLSEEEKITQIIKIFSATCAAFAVQPIPFADIFVLTPIQGYMGSRIAAIRGINIKEEKASEIVKEIAGVVGLGVLAQQIAIGAYKTFIPFLGAITTIPMVYGLTYAIGKVMDFYFEKKSKGEKIQAETMKNLYKKYIEEGKKIGKKEKKKIK